MDVLQKFVDGRTDLYQELLENGRRADSDAGDGTPLIAWAAYYGDVSAVRSLLREGARLDQLGPDLGIMASVFHHHWQLTQFLLESGADARAADVETGETLLHAALCRALDPRTYRVVALLLAAGADPNARTIPGRESGGFMRDAYTKAETPLHRAAAFADEQTIDLLLEAGAEREAEDCNGESPLGWASRHLRPGRILGLLLHGQHRIHPVALERNRSDHGVGTSGMQENLIGFPHYTPKR